MEKEEEEDVDQVRNQAEDIGLVQSQGQQGCTEGLARRRVEESKANGGREDVCTSVPGRARRVR